MGWAGVRCILHAVELERARRRLEVIFQAITTDVGTYGIIIAVAMVIAVLVVNQHGQLQHASDNIIPRGLVLLSFTTVTCLFVNRVDAPLDAWEQRGWIQS